MKMLIAIMMIRVIIALIANTKRKNSNDICNDADNAKVQHPAANLLR